MFDFTKDTQQQIKQLIKPSWLSALLMVTIGLALTAGAIVVFSIIKGGFEHQLLSWQQTQPTAKPLSAPGAVVTASRPTLDDTWPLMIVWGLAGFIVYFFAVATVHSLGRVKDTAMSLEYVNAKRTTILESLVSHFAVRFVAIIIFISLFYLFIKYIVPYSITAAHASASDVLSKSGIFYSILSFLLVIVTLHLLTIFLRLSLGRARVFSNNIV